MRRIRTLGIILTSTAIFWGCSESGTGPEDQLDLLVDGLAVLETGDSRVPLLVAHEDGTVITLGSQGRDGFIDRVNVIDGAGNDFTVLLGPDGLPERAYAGGEVFLFANWTESTVDIGVVRQNLEIELVREVDIAGLQPGASSQRAGPSTVALLDPAGFQDLLSQETIDVLRFVGLTTGVAACGVAIIVSAGIALPCGAAALTAVAFVASDVPGLQESAGAFGLVAGVAGCGGDPFSCGAAVIEATLIADDAADAALATRADEISAAEGALETGGGDVQVTLTWDTSADLDLWVTDPFGERIFYANRTSGSGGRLDRDDTNGFGPENVFWPSGAAPPGEYRVQVDHFSGASPTRFTVLVQAFGVVQSFDGAVSRDQTNTVTVFDSGGSFRALSEASHRLVGAESKTPSHD